MDKPKLLPCPFCGGRAFYTKDANAPVLTAAGDKEYRNAKFRRLAGDL